MISMADFTPSAPLSISMIESFIGLPPSEEANIASSSIFEEIIFHHQCSDQKVSIS